MEMNRKVVSKVFTNEDLTAEEIDYLYGYLKTQEKKLPFSPKRWVKKNWKECLLSAGSFVAGVAGTIGMAYAIVGNDEQASNLVESYKNAALPESTGETQN